MIAALILAQTVTTLAPPIKVPRPATTWSCNFTGADAASFTLGGYFAEAPVGSDPNVSMPTMVKGDGPAFLQGAQRYHAHDSLKDLRMYMVSLGHRDGSHYTAIFNLVNDQNAGLATITRYVPDTATGRGKLHAFATGHCSATFHPLGHKGAGK